MLNRRSFTQSLLALSCVPGATSPALAQAGWPNRPIKVLVPSAAGGSADFWARFMCERLAAALKQPFVVENRPGASGMLVTTALAQAKPDGYTLAMSFASALVPTMTLEPNAKHNWTDLQPIARFGSLGGMIVVTPDVPARNLKELVAYIQANPGKLSYATYGVASGPHIAMEALKKMAGLDIQHVPYPGSAKILTELQGGVIKIAATDPVSPMPFLKQGTLFGIAVNGPSRLPATPDVPTMAEEGYPIFMPSWYGFFGPKGLPRPIVDRINAEVKKIMADPETLERFKSSNTATSEHLSPEQFSAFIKSEVDEWGKFIREGKMVKE